MNTTLRDALAEQIDEVGPAHLDVDELVGLGESRLRRRRLTAALGSAAAVVLVIALAIGGAALNRSADQGRRTPNTDHQQTDDTRRSQPQARPIVYSDDVAFGATDPSLCSSGPSRSATARSRSTRQ